VAAESSTGTWTTYDRPADRPRLLQGPRLPVEDVPVIRAASTPSSPTRSTCSRRAAWSTCSPRWWATSSASRPSGRCGWRTCASAPLRAHLRWAPERDHRGARQDGQVRPSLLDAPSSRSSACRARTTAGPSTSACGAPRLHQGRRERQLAALHALARPVRERRRGAQVGGAETGERKGHYLNVTAPTVEDMYERAEFAKELGMPIIMHDFLTAGFTANTSLANWCRRNGMLLHIHAPCTRHRPQSVPRHPLRVLVKCLGCPVVTTCIRARSSASSRRPRGDARLDRPDARALRARAAVAGHLLRPGLRAHAGPVSGGVGGIHVGTSPRWWPSSGTTPSSSSAGHARHRGATRRGHGERVALEACVEARNDGRDVENEGTRSSPRRQVEPRAGGRLETWRNIRFEYDSVDKLDEVAK